MRDELDRLYQNRGGDDWPSMYWTNTDRSSWDRFWGEETEYLKDAGKMLEDGSFVSLTISEPSLMSDI